METLKLQVGICDDEPFIAKQLSQILNEIAVEKAYGMEIHVYGSGIELLDTLYSLDILFLDIEMPEMDGIEVGRRLRQVQKDCRIIMATSVVERFKEAFEIQAFRFITKPFEREEIARVLEAVMESRIGMETVSFYETRMEVDVMQRQIYYLWSCDSSVEARIGDRILRREGSLNEMERILDSRLFFRVHKKYLVNLLHISKYHDGVIYIGDIKITVSRRRKKEFEAAYRKFDVNYR